MARGITLVAAALVAGSMAGGAAWAADAPATAPAASTAPASALFAEVVEMYMKGRWEELEKTLKDKAKELGQLSTEEQTGIATIRVAVREGRPEWWDKTKSGNKVQIMPVVWGRKLIVMYDPKVRYGMEVKVDKGKMFLTAGWNHADMDSTASAGSTFTKGDVGSLAAFACLGGVEAWSLVSNPGSQIQLNRYLEFRGKLTGMTFGTPGARRYGMQQCLASFTEENPKPQERMARRAIGTMLMIEVLSKPEAFPSVALPGSLAAENAEGTLGLALAPVVGKTAWTFAEDQLVRTALKQLAQANGIKAQQAATVQLQNDLKMSLDPRADEALAAERNAWIKKQFDKVKSK